MIEKIIISYLNTNLSGAEAYAEEPIGESKFVIVEKLGSGTENKIKSASIAVQSYGSTLLEAAELNESVKSVMEGIIELGSISKCKLNTDYNFTNVSKKQYRYQAIFDITYFD